MALEVEVEVALRVEQEVMVKQIMAQEMENKAIAETEHLDQQTKEAVLEEAVLGAVVQEVTMEAQEAQESWSSATQFNTHETQEYKE
tara:strand:+ start:59 stop:319 length:261 start_codon:yes stop_codon:yes gene_type:complete